MTHGSAQALSIRCPLGCSMQSFPAVLWAPQIRRVKYARLTHSGFTREVMERWSFITRSFAPIQFGCPTSSESTILMLLSWLQRELCFSQKHPLIPRSAPLTLRSLQCLSKAEKHYLKNKIFSKFPILAASPRGGFLDRRACRAWRMRISTWSPTSATTTTPRRKRNQTAPTPRAQGEQHGGHASPAAQVCLQDGS